MDILIYILFIVALLLLIFNFLIYSALNKVFRYKEFGKSKVNISVVIAAKNEADNIVVLIDSLKNQIFDKDKYEVIIVDDNSNDNTFEIAKQACSLTNNFKVIKAENKIFEGKRGALDIGIKNSQNPYILITDADCIPNSEWINSFANGFENDSDFLFGVAPFKSSNSIVNLIARFENLRASIIVFAFSKLGLPYSASARSFGFSKEAFDKINGYENTTSSLSGDDDLLLQQAIKHGLKISKVTNQEAFVFSKTKETYLEYANQKSRHTSTSIYYSKRSQMILLIWHILNITSIFSVFLIPINILFVFPFFIKLVIDIFVLNNFQGNFGYKLNPILFIALQIHYEINLIYFFYKGLQFTDRWE